MPAARYLLYDSGCGACTRIAETVEREGKGLVTARSLRDPEIQALLQGAANWRWEPMLLEASDRSIRVWRGLGIGLRLSIMVGPRRAFRIARIAMRERTRLTGVSSERRRFLSLTAKTAAFLATGFASMLFRQREATGAALPTTGGNADGSRLVPSTNDWRAQIRVVRSTEVTGTELQQVLERFRQSRDTKQLDWLLRRHALIPEEAHHVAVQHELADGNTLLAIGAAWAERPDGAFGAIHYHLARPVEHFQSSTAIYSISSKAADLLATSVNGRLVTIPVGIGIQSHCGGCVDPTVGPWEHNWESCASYDWGCLRLCCGPCALTCWLFPSACFACIAAWCSYCFGWECCAVWQHTCNPCATF